MSIESDVFEGGPVPKHTYETTDGTKPTPHGVHEPRTMAHTVTVGKEGGVLNMMTEIGDGTFVAWSQCASCHKQVAECKCPGGPVEPSYMKKWRDSRFERSLDERPEPDYKLIPKLVGWLRERGYTVSKKGAAPVIDVDEPVTQAEPAPEVTAGIEAAIEAVQPAPVPAEKLEAFDVDF